MILERTETLVGGTGPAVLREPRRVHCIYSPRRYDAVRRLIDLTVSLALLLVLAPLFLLVAAAVSIESPGGPFFCQDRFGQHGRRFQVFKFRTMRSDLGDRSGAARTKAGDPRCTRLGAFLRKTSLDELPQLINVVRGDMALIGPRPHAVAMQVDGQLYEKVVLCYHMRHAVRPGITGWAQINGSRGEVSTIGQADQRVRLDFFYIRNRGPCLDAEILALTVRHLLKGSDHAY